VDCILLGAAIGCVSNEVCSLAARGTAAVLVVVVDTGGCESWVAGELITGDPRTTPTRRRNSSLVSPAAKYSLRSPFLDP